MRSRNGHASPEATGVIASALLVVAMLAAGCSVPMRFLRQGETPVPRFPVTPTSPPPPVTSAPVSGPPSGNADWPSYGNDIQGTHYTDLDQINPTNVAQLQPAWILHTTVGLGNTSISFETQPLVIEGTMYFSSPHDHVFAVDAATGAIKWTYNPSMTALSDIAICCGQANRGVAYGKGKVYIAQLDANLVALDASTGSVVWKTPVETDLTRYSETMAPLYYDNKVFVGISGGEFEIRGHFSAYDADTGNLLWRFYTVPGPGELGNDTWAGDSWQSGGAPVWTTPTIDPQLGLIYFGTGNASPDLNGSTRAGMNLFANSVVALDMDTGERVWHFQEVHHDIWDYDGPKPTLLFNMVKDGQTIPALWHANKSGYQFFYDRRNGQPIFPVTEQPVPSTDPSWQNAWPTQPIPATDPLIPQAVEMTPPGLKSAPLFTPPQETPLLIQPGFETGPEWPPSAYSPRTGYIYVAAGGYEPWLYHAEQSVEATLGSSAAPYTEPEIVQYGLLQAVDTSTGRIVWTVKTNQKLYSGVAAAGDLVFTGESTGKFDAFDARTGQLLWSWQSEQPGVGPANGSPTVYMVGGREYVVMAFGGAARVWADASTNSKLPPPGDALIAFALPTAAAGATTPTPAVITASNVTPVPLGGVPKAGAMTIANSASPGAAVVTLQAQNLAFVPNTFTVPPGQPVSVHVINTSQVATAGFAIQLPSGLIGWSGSLMPGQDGYFNFTAPMQPGTYTFYSNASSDQKFQGFTGTMTVAAGAPTPTMAPTLTPTPTTAPVLTPTPTPSS